MEEELNYREELEKARKVAKSVELRGYPKEIDAYWEVICGLVLVAEEDMQEMREQWEVASLAREMLEYARPLEGYDHMLEKLYEATKRMINVISEHPRLKAELLEFQILLLSRVAESFDYRGSLEDDLQEELDILRQNIEYADKGEWDKIVDNSHLNHDPIEWSARWEEVIDDVDREVEKELKDFPRGMGFCHAFWPTRSSVLAKYGIEWRSPSVMNPRVLFD